MKCLHGGEPSLTAARGAIVLDSVATAMLYSDRLPDGPPQAAVGRRGFPASFQEEGVWCQLLDRPGSASRSRSSPSSFYPPRRLTLPRDLPHAASVAS